MYGFRMDSSSAKTESLTIPGLYSDKICKLAKENNIYVCCGLTEKMIKLIKYIIQVLYV